VRYSASGFNGHAGLAVFDAPNLSLAGQIGGLC
jgi:hypothetical protein